MKLFANCYKDNDVLVIAARKRNIVLDYLNRHYNQETALKYIAFYDKKVQDYNHDVDISSDSERINKFIKVENRIIEQCNHINIELQHEQKIVLLIFLLDLIHSSDNLTADELAMVWSIAANLKIR